MALGLDPRHLAGLLRAPDAPLEGRLAGVAYQARVAIPDYAARIERHYGRDPAALGMAFGFRHFGLVIAFEAPVEVAVHDADRRLDPGLRALVARFGPVVLRNAHLPERERANGQRNVFQSLSFHVDRGQIPTVLDIDPFHGAHRLAGQARRAARCGTPDSEIAGKRRPLAPRGTRRADVPHPKGRALLVASGVARRLRCPHRGATRS